MKTLVTVSTVLFAVSRLCAQAPATDKPVDPKTTVVKPADPKPVAPKPKLPPPTPVKKVEEPKIPGQTVARANGTFLGLEVVDGKFKLSFYDKKKKPMTPDVIRGNARWPNVHGSGDNRTVLNLSGNALVGSKPVIPPLIFNVFLNLVKNEGEDPNAVEAFVVPFRG